MTAQKGTVAVVGTGDMGHAVGGALVRAGYRVVTAGAGRSALSQQLAAESGIEDLGSLEAVMRAAQLVLSIVPPAAAPSFARERGAGDARGRRAARVRRLQRRCARDGAAIARAFAPTGAPFVDVGIVGRGPGPGGERTRFYVSGEARAAVLEPRRRGARARRPRRGDRHGIGDEDGLFGAEQRHGCAADRGAARRGAARRARAAHARARAEPSRGA